MRLLRHIFLCGFALILLPVALAQAPAAEDRNKVILNFVGADIQSVVKTIGMITGTNFILDPRVTGTVNIISAKPVERDLVYPILLSALRMQGFAAVESPNGVVKIVPEADAKLNYSPTLLGRPQVAGDRIITQVYPLRYESAVQLVPVLRPLIAPNNVINAYPNSNTLVITDYAENLRRIDKIISAIDVAPASELHTIKLEHASAIDVAQLLTRLMPEASAPTAVPGGQPKLVFAVDARVNSLIVRSDAPATLEKVRTLVRGMDVPSAAGGNIRVVYLRNAEATKVAETLRGILSGGAGGGQPVAAPASPAAPGQPAAAPAAAPVTIPASAGGGTIQAYPATNSLVIVAPDYVYNSLRDVIDKLDARRAQVFVEALIAEVSTTTAAEFGIQWQDLSGINSTDTKVIGGTNFSTSTAGAGTNIIGAARNIATVGPGLNVGVVKGRINIPGVGEVLNLGALARALESQANANILSTPNLLTIDNEEAKIVVGQNVPFVTGSFSQATGTTGAAVNPFQTIERRDVGLTLKVKPTVAEGGTIKLQIFQEVSSLTRTANVSTADVVTNKRSIESTVLVDDGQIVVLGGLIQDDVQNSQDKVPLLGNIPIIGNLFKYDSRRRVKTNLMVFIRPVVLRDGQAPGQITNERYDYIRKEQADSESPPHWLLPDVGGPKLPEQKPQSMLEPYMRMDRSFAGPADSRAAPAQTSPTQSAPAAEPAPAYEMRPTPNNPMGGVARQRDSAARLTVPKTTSDAAAAAPAPAAPVKRAPPPPTSAPAAQAPATAAPVVRPAPVAAPTPSAQTKPMPAAATAPATPAPVVAQPAPVATPSSAVKAAQAPAKPEATPPAKVAAAPAKPAATAPRPSSTSYRPPRPGAKPSDVGLFGDNLMPAATSTKPRVN